MTGKLETLLLLLVICQKASYVEQSLAVLDSVSDQLTQEFVSLTSHKVQAIQFMEEVQRGVCNTD